MMRQGDKLASYRMLAAALDGCRHLPWRSISSATARPGRGRDLFAHLRHPVCGFMAASTTGSIWRRSTRRPISSSGRPSTRLTAWCSWRPRPRLPGRRRRLWRRRERGPPRRDGRADGARRHRRLRRRRSARLVDDAHAPPRARASRAAASSAASAISIGPPCASAPRSCRSSAGRPHEHARPHRRHASPRRRSPHPRGRPGARLRAGRACDDAGLGRHAGAARLARRGRRSSSCRRCGPPAPISGRCSTRHGAPIDVRSPGAAKAHAARHAAVRSAGRRRHRALPLRPPRSGGRVHGAARRGARHARRGPLSSASVRDILVASGEARADRGGARARLGALYDAVLVHGDPDLVPLERSWPVETAMRRRSSATPAMSTRARAAVAEPTTASEARSWSRADRARRACRSTARRSPRPRR